MKSPNDRIEIDGSKRNSRPIDQLHASDGVLSKEDREK